MIKRRFYRAEHADKDGGADDSSSSSSSSDSEIEAQSPQDSDTEQQPLPTSKIHGHGDGDGDGDGDVNAPSSLKPMSPSSSSSGYEREDSSAHEIEAESEGLLTNDDDGETKRDGVRIDVGRFSRKVNSTAVATDHHVADDVPNCVLKCKSTFKCRLCPKIVCLNEESLKAHLTSKRHARSEKLLKDGRLKRILNSDGEEVVFSDDDGETHAERHARILALAQNTAQKKSKGRQRQRQRLKRKKQNLSNIQNNQEKDNRAKRRKKVE